MNILTIVPFRKGSKGLLNKALCELGGEPLWVRTIKCATDAGLDPWVYTDYDRNELIKHSLIPMLPRSPSDDHETTEHALQCALLEYNVSRPAPDAVAWMTVNTPCRWVGWIEQAMEAFTDGEDWDSVFLCEPTDKQYWSHNYGRWHRETSGIYGPRQRKTPELYIEHCGVFCVTKREYVERGIRIGPRALGIPINHPYIGLDIHTSHDLAVARILEERGAL